MRKSTRGQGRPKAKTSRRIVGKVIKVGLAHKRCARCGHPLSRSFPALCGPCERTFDEEYKHMINKMDEGTVSLRNALKIIEWWGR